MKSLFISTITLVLGASAIAANKPNIIFVLTDDLGYGDVSCLNPDSKIKTPNIDNFAASGITFTDAHTGSAVCTPTRYGVVTGRYAWRTGLKGGVVSGFAKSMIPNDRTTMASMLKAQGYNTAFIGKWHLGWDWGVKDGFRASTKVSTNPKYNQIKPEGIDYSKPVTNGPATVGFDYYFGICGSLDMPPYVYVDNGIPTDPSNDKKILDTVNRKGHIGSDFVQEEVQPKIIEKSCEYIRKQAKADKPFFLYLPMTGPHTPILPTKDFQGRTTIGAYGDFVEEVDFLFAKIIKTLEEEGIRDNTIVVFTSDNGCSPAARYADLHKKGHYPSAQFRGQKGDLYDGGHRVPCMISWPAKIKKGQLADQTICLTDFLATFADIAGYKLKDNEAEDSVALTTVLKDPKGAKEVRSSIVHHAYYGAFAVRMGDWKLLVHPAGGGFDDKKLKLDQLPPLQLYNMKDDIGEKNNLYASNPEKAKELLTQLRKIIEEGRNSEGAKQANDPTDKWVELEDVMKNY